MNGSVVSYNHVKEIIIYKIENVNVETHLRVRIIPYKEGGEGVRNGVSVE